ncbi:LTA synthase family protein [Halodesulfovibrio spirochaetisodalis]|uniref:LTA synthase family protein n=1 Tax=Halodesulfovibrio spirochaetisodalis TaxID=1560234 RepID=UPI0018D44701|nr:LTA synthase family protein [Halodesulfovibrio spirochaetisodalis]
MFFYGGVVLNYRAIGSKICAFAAAIPEHLCELFFLFILSIAIRHENIWGSLVTYGTAILCYFLFSLFLNRKQSFVLTFLVAVGISLSSCIKTELLGIPLQLYDFQMVLQLLNVDGLSDISQFWEIHEAQLTFLYSSITLVVYSLLFWKKQPVQKFYAWMLILPFLGVGTIIFAMKNVEPDIYNQMDNLKRHGAFGILYSQLYKAASMTPEGYSASIQKSFPVNSSSKERPDTLPNIVLVLLESTIDPSRLTDIKVEPYPTPFLEELKKKSLYGRLSVPGGTANAEYEVLTSLPLKSLPTTRVPFMEINRHTYSLPSFLSEMGYQSFAYHMGTQKFYNRNVVFKEMGIEKYYTRENYPDKTICVKRFYHDSTMFSSIFSKLKKSMNPIFAHALTLIPHHPYDEKHAKFAFNVNSKNSDAENKRLANYFSRLRYTQNDLAAFIKQVNTLPRRTLVLMYSDHLPPLSSMRKEKGSLFYLLYDSKGQLPTGKNSDLATYELATMLLKKSFFPLRGIDSIVSDEHNADKLELIHFDMLYGEQYLSKLFTN